MVAYHVAQGDYRRAIEIGDAGLALVDRTGYVAWGIHRLLPMMIEAALWMGDLDLARRYEQRLRRDSVQLGHQLGIAWADTCNALIAMLQKDYETAAPALRQRRRSARGDSLAARRGARASQARVGARARRATWTARCASCAARTTHSCGCAPRWS